MRASRLYSFLSSGTTSRILSACRLRLSESNTSQRPSFAEHRLAPDATWCTPAAAAAAGLWLILFNNDCTGMYRPPPKLAFAMDDLILNLDLGPRQVRSSGERKNISHPTTTHSDMLRRQATAESSSSPLVEEEPMGGADMEGGEAEARVNGARGLG